MKLIGNSISSVVEEIKSNQEKFKQTNYLGSFRLAKGLKLFAYNIHRESLEEVSISESDTLDLLNPLSSSKKVSVELDTVYVEALNKKNAVKKIYAKKNNIL